MYCKEMCVSAWPSGIHGYHQAGITNKLAMYDVDKFENNWITQVYVYFDRPTRHI